MAYFLGPPCRLVSSGKFLRRLCSAEVDACLGDTITRPDVLRCRLTSSEQSAVDVMAFASSGILQRNTHVYRPRCHHHWKTTQSCTSFCLWIYVEMLFAIHRFYVHLDFQSKVVIGHSCTAALPIRKWFTGLPKSRNRLANFIRG